MTSFLIILMRYQGGLAKTATQVTQTVGQTLMDYYEENKMFNKWLRKQKMNPLAELYARHLYFNVGGWEAVHEWQSAQQSVQLTDGGHAESDSESNPSTIGN